jgi:dynactin complex subunit
MRPAEYSTENPPRPIDCVETKEYINSLRRRIEVQTDSMEHLASQVHTLLGKIDQLNNEVEKLSLDLGIQREEVPPGWKEVKK